MKAIKQVAPLSRKRLAEIRADMRSAPPRCDPADAAVRDLLKEVGRLQKNNKQLGAICLQNLDTGAELVGRLYERSVALEKSEASVAGFKVELAEQETAALQWAKALAEHKNEISRLRAEAEEFRRNARKVLLAEMMDPARCFTDTAKDWAEENNTRFTRIINAIDLSSPPAPVSPSSQDPAGAGVQLTQASAQNLARMDYWRYVEGAEKPKVDGTGWAFPDNSTNPRGWNVYTGPELQYVGSENLLCVVKITEGEINYHSDEDEREIIDYYETSGLPVYEGDDYVVDAEGCYLTRDEANALATESAAAPQGEETRREEVAGEC